MNPKIKGAAILLMTLLLGFGLGYLLHDSLMFPPSDHQTIIDNTVIIDTRISFPLTPKLVDSGVKTYGEGLPLEIVFVKGKDYVQTTWLWQRYGDTELVMTIWGPGDDGKTYSIEIGKVAADPFVVTVGGVTKLTIPEVYYDAAGMIGYYQFYLIVTT